MTTPAEARASVDQAQSTYEQCVADVAKINRNTSFVEDLNADSLDQVELVMEFEDEFETSIPDEQAEKIKTVGHAIEFIKQAQGLN